VIKPDYSVKAPQELGVVHMVGIGGSGMSGIARLLRAQGITVTGSDSRDSSNIEALRQLGCTITIGHDAKNVGDANTLIVTGALWEDNPEYVFALKKGLPVLHRSVALEWLTRGQRLVSVAGAHGKTTSTGMIVTALRELGEDPSFVNGGVVQAYGLSAEYGQGELFVVEADESDGSFLLYDTDISLITNVDADHLDHYGSYDAFDQAFIDFANATDELVVISSDDPGAIRIAEHIHGPRVLTFGQSPSADVWVSSISTDSVEGVTFSVKYLGNEYSTTLKVPGIHNALNAAGAFAVLVGIGLDPQSSLQAVSAFAGTQRRFELHGVVDNVSVYDDYAHHHSEVEAVLTAARTVVGDGRIIAVHQPHLYSRTAQFCGEFALTLERDADLTVVLDVYGAREDPVDGVTGELVSEKFTDSSRVAFISDWQQAADHIAAISQSGDIVITLGCGDVYRMIPQILSALESK
jgi:UDP-N-acetylmuramate--alanine ligase